jgi:hypothetical protein
MIMSVWDTWQGAIVLLKWLYVDEQCSPLAASNVVCLPIWQAPPAEQQAVVDAYRQTVAQNYLAATGKSLADGEWPVEQATLAITKLASKGSKVEPLAPLTCQLAGVQWISWVGNRGGGS